MKIGRGEKGNSEQMSGASGCLAKLLVHSSTRRHSVKLRWVDFCHSMELFPHGCSNFPPPYPSDPFVAHPLGPALSPLPFHSFFLFPSSLSFYLYSLMEFSIAKPPSTSKHLLLLLLHAPRLPPPPQSLSFTTIRGEQRASSNSKTDHAFP